MVLCLSTILKNSAHLFALKTNQESKPLHSPLTNSEIIEIENRKAEASAKDVSTTTQSLAQLAANYLIQNKKEDARNTAAWCLAMNARNSDCNSILISTYTRYGEFDEVYPYLLDCLAAEPKNIHCLGGMESYNLHIGKFQAAKDILHFHSFFWISGKSFNHF